MQRDLIAEAIKSIGWDTTTGAPIANAENMQLLTAMTKLMEEKSQLDNVLQSDTERVDRILTHETNAKLNIEQNVTLLNAYQCEIRTENHLYKLAERENSKLKQDAKQLQHELEGIKKYECATLKEIQRRTSTIEEMTNRISWAKAALDEWHKAIDDNNEANKLVEKYCKQDADNLYRLDVKRKAIQNEINKNRKILIDLYNDQKSLENNLDRTANLYRIGHAERRQMVDTWKSAVNQMNQREDDIENAENDLEESKYRSEKKRDDLKALVKQLETIIHNNRETEKCIELLNDETSEIKENVQQIINSIILKTNDIDIITKELQNLDHFIKQQRRDNRRKIKEIADKENEITNFEDIHKKLEARYDRLTNKNMGANERLQLLEDMVDSEEKTKLRLSQETEKIDTLIYRAQQQLLNSESDKKIRIVENTSTKSETAALKRSKKQLEKEIARQTEVHYELALKALQLDTRIGKMRGNETDPAEEEKLQSYLLYLEKSYEQAAKKLETMQTQTARIEDNMRQVTTVFNNDSKRIENMNNEIKESKLYYEGGLKQIKQSTQLHQEKIVEYSILKMRVNDMELQMQECETMSYNLDKHRENLKRVIQQRMLTIDNQIEILNQKKKHLSDENSTLKADIGERTLRMNAAKIRYELTVKLLGVNDDGTMVTSTQMKVEAAQEKQLLLDEGNTLNESVLRAENEIKSMERTLCLLNNSNDTYRKAFQIPDIDGDGMTELTELQSKYCNALAKLKSSRQLLINEDRTNEELRKEKHELENNLDLEMRTIAENKEILTKVHKELLDQSTKIQRAEREVKIAFKNLRKRPICSDYINLIEMDIDLRELQIRNASAIQRYQSLAELGDAMSQKVNRSVCDKSLKFPQLLKSQSSISWFSDITDVSISSSRSNGNLRTSSRSSLSDNIAGKDISARASVVSLSFPTPKDLRKK